MSVRVLSFYFGSTRRHYLSAAVCLCCVLLSACSEPAREKDVQLTHLSGPAMGTRWSVTLHPGADSRSASVQAISPDPLYIRTLIEAELDRLTALMSTWESSSELSQFNRMRSIEPVSLHDEILDVMDTALRISRLSDGAYDITLQPVIDLWGFNRDTLTSEPDARAIENALRLSGHHQLVRTGDTVRKRQPQVSVDVSSLAKGYAVDKLGDILESLSIDNYLVDIGGEIRARGVRPDGLVWRVGLESPEGEVSQVITLQDSHIATSGTYRNFRWENGVRLSHIIDGLTGRPIQHDLVSVSVIHQSTMLADAWATALLVVGEPRAQRLIRQHGLDAQLTVYRDDRFQRLASAGFAARLLGDQSSRNRQAGVSR